MSTIAALPLVLDCAGYEQKNGERLMASPEIEALVRRVGVLEAELAALLQAINVGRGGSIAITAPAGLSIAVGGMCDISVGAGLSITAGSNFTTSVGSAYVVNVGAGMKTSAGTGIAFSAGTAFSVNANRDLTLATRALDVAASVGVTIKSSQDIAITSAKGFSVTSGKMLAVKAADGMVFDAGPADLSLKKDGTIDLKGKDVTIRASGKINATAGSDVVIKGSKIRQN
jgi:type VI secretion system secreted protein VgrG